MDQALLQIETPNAPPMTYMVPTGGEITIGRDETCTVVLASPDISRRHVTITVQPAGIAVRDSSSNGTQVGSQRVFRSEIPVPFGTPIQVGPYVIRVMRQGAPAGVGAPPPPPMGAAPGGVPGLPPLPGQRPHNPMAQTMATPAVGPAGGGLGALAQGAQGQRRGVNGAGHTVAPVGGTSGTMHVSVELRRRIHRMLLDNLDLAALDRSKMADNVMRPQGARRPQAHRRSRCHPTSRPGTDQEQLMQEMSDEALGLGPLEQLSRRRDSMSEIMVVDPQTIYVERKGKLVRVDASASPTTRPCGRASSAS
jgi:pilus assembly protein CpaF